MIEDNEVRTRYLSLALDARRVIDILLPFVTTGQKTTELEATLREVLESLQFEDNVDSLLASLQTRQHPYSYEEITTLDGVAEGHGRRVLAQKLSDVLDSDEATQKVSASQALTLFFVVESNALHQFNEPNVNSTKPTVYAA
jgi:hypothetical protein